MTWIAILFLGGSFLPTVVAGLRSHFFWPIATTNGLMFLTIFAPIIFTAAWGGVEETSIASKFSAVLLLFSIPVWFVLMIWSVWPKRRGRE